MFIDFSIKDLIDILLVAYLLYQTQPAEEAGPQSMGNAFLLKRTSLFLLKR